MKKITIQIIFTLLFSTGNLYGQPSETKKGDKKSHFEISPIVNVFIKEEQISAY